AAAQDLRPHVPRHGPRAGDHGSARLVAGARGPRGARARAGGARQGGRRVAGRQAARPALRRRAAARFPRQGPRPPPRARVAGRAGHRRRLPGGARPARPAGGLPPRDRHLWQAGDGGDDHARHGGRAVPRRHGPGPEPPPHGLRPARRGAGGRQAQAGLRAQAARASGGAVTLLEALSLPFLQRALVAGVLIAVGTGLLGVFVVQRRLSFLGDGLAHAAFGGMGIGAFTIVATGLVGSGLALLRDPIWIAVPFSLLAAYGIYALRRRTDLSSDTAIGIAFAVTVALGVMFFSLIPPDANL